MSTAAAPLLQARFADNLANISAELTERKLVVCRGLLTRTENTVPLDKITDMALIQRPLMRLFGLKKLKQETAGQSGNNALISLVGIVDADGFRAALLALVFLNLGAGIMHDSGASLADSGAQFTGQLISLYASVLGEWSRMLIALVALLCIFSTTVTVLNGYSRPLDAGWRLLLERRPSGKRLAGIMLVMSLLALLLILFFKGALLSLLELVMIQAFMTTCIFAWLNLRLISSKTLPTEIRYGKGMQLWGWLGLGYLFGFALLFIYWYCYIK